jgi:hypothetical protein
MVVLSNGAFVAYQLQCALGVEMSRHGITRNLPWHDQCDEAVAIIGARICYAFFILETVIRAVAERKQFLIGYNGTWNIFDVSLLLLGLWPVITTDAFLESAIPNMTILRIVGVPRMIRCFKAPYIWRSSRIPRLMMYSIINSIPLLIWAIIIILLVTYFFAVPFSFVVCKYLRQLDIDAVTYEQREIVDGASTYFASFTLTFLSLMMSIFGGVDWFEIWQPLAAIHRAQAFFFCLFVGLMIIGPMNVITGIFVENATQISALNRDMQVQELVERDKQLEQALREAFGALDEDNSGTLSWQEFSDNIDRMRPYLATLDLSVSDAKGLFKLVDIQETDSVTIDDFIQGCMRLKGTAKSIDLCTLLYENRRQSRALQKLTRFCEKHMNDVNK